MFGFTDADANVIPEESIIVIADEYSLLLEFLPELQGIALFHTAENEICLRGVWYQPGNCLQFDEQPLPFIDDFLNRGLQVIDVFQRFFYCHHRGNIDVIGYLYLQDIVGYLRREQSVTYPQSREARPLAERTQHDQISVFPNQRDNCLATELIVCFIDHHYHTCFKDFSNVRFGYYIPGGIIRIGQEYYLCPVGYGSLHRRHVGIKIIIPRHLHGVAAAPRRADFVYSEGRYAVYHFLSPVQEKTQYQVDKLVTAATGDDVFFIDSAISGQHLSQLCLPVIGVDVIFAI